ncbi:NADH dehydrogenase Fe-S protein subunit 6 ndufs6 [Mactra antiquata]
MAAVIRGLLRLPLRNVVTRPVSSSSALYSAEGPNVDQITHTGQQWDKDDYRRARFVDKDKQYNPNFAIDLIAKDPVVVCNQRSVSSNSGGALGHPKVFINLDKPEVSICGYSGRKFIQKKFYDSAKHGPSITYEQYLEEMEREKS